MAGENRSAGHIAKLLGVSDGEGEEGAGGLKREPPPSLVVGTRGSQRSPGGRLRLMCQTRSTSTCCLTSLIR